MYYESTNNSSTAKHDWSCLQIGNAFAQQYYRVLDVSPEQVHKFYHDESILGRPDSDGALTSITTTHVISLKYSSSIL